MKMIHKIKMYLLCLVLPFIIPIQSSASDDQSLSVRSFSTLPLINNVRISPDGKKIIFFQNTEGKTLLVSKNFITGKLTLISTADNEKIKFYDALWANNEKVLFTISGPDYLGITPMTNTRLYIRNVDASDDGRTLVKTKNDFLQFQSSIISLLPDDPDHVLIGMNVESQYQDTAYKVNLDTGDKTIEQHYIREVGDWIADQQGRIRVGTGYNTSTMNIGIQLYDLVEKKWYKAWNGKALSQTLMEPLGFGLDPNLLYVRALHDGRNAIFRVDISKPDFPKELVAKNDTYDINGSLIYSPKTKDVVGVYNGEADGRIYYSGAYYGETDIRRIYWNEDYRRFQEAVDRALPDTANYLTDFSEDEKHYIVFSTSGKTPGKYYLGNFEKGTLELIADSYPQLDGMLQGSKKLISYTAQDGKTIKGYLTLPANDTPSSPGPAVIFPHWGPMNRDFTDFDYWADYFASKGIVVLKPIYRGSSVYGKEFGMEALQSFESMENDLTDAVNWLIDQKLADPSRIVIAGRGFGGYAALIGATKTPDLFRCAISFAGISDLPTTLDSTARSFNFLVLREQLGSNKKLLEAASPLRHADKIKIPILMGHGDEDRIIPVKQSQIMAKKLKKKKKIFNYIELEKGNHSLDLQGNRHRFFEAMDEFLNKYLLDKS